MVKIYHNPRCSTSRRACDSIIEVNEPYEIVNYMKNPLTISEINDLIDKLGIRPIELVRTKETVWKENYSGRELSDNQIIEAMHLHPNLIQRPIIVKGKRAIIGRPLELIKEFLQK